MDSGDSLNQRPQTPLERFIPNPKLKFMEQCREVMRFRRLAYRSEQAYLEWIKRFILFQGKRHPKDMGEPRSAVVIAASPCGRPTMRRAEPIGV